MVKTLELMTISQVGDVWTCPKVEDRIVHKDYGFAWSKTNGSIEPVQMIQSVIELDGWVKYVPAFLVGDWVYDETIPTDPKIYQVSSEQHAKDLNDGKFPHIRKATEFEIAYERERRWWEYIGRSRVGELQTGDIVTVNDEIWFISVVNGDYYKSKQAGDPGIKIESTEKVKLLATCTMVLKK